MQYYAWFPRDLRDGLFFNEPKHSNHAYSSYLGSFTSRQGQDVRKVMAVVPAGAVPVAKEQSVAYMHGL